MLSTTQTLVGLAVAAGLSSAQSTISLYIPIADQMPLVASVMASDSTATTYAVQCPEGSDPTDCGLAGGIILTQGPKTAAYTLSEGYQNGTSSVLAFTGYVDCSLDGTSTAVCVESYGGDEANDPGTTTETFSGTDFSYFPATLTTSSLSVGFPYTSFPAAAAGPSSTSGAPTVKETGASSSTVATTHGASETASKTGSTAATTMQTSSSKAATGGLAMVTANAQWVVGGAALAAALL